MNNATYFDGENGRMKLQDAFVKWCNVKRVHASNISYSVILNFAKSPAMTVLDFTVGDIVQFDDAENKGLYGIVHGYHENALALDNGATAWAPSTLYVRGQNDVVYAFKECHKTVRAPSFPQGLVELVRNQLQKNCPLKEATCHE